MKKSGWTWSWFWSVTLISLICSEVLLFIFIFCRCFWLPFFFILLYPDFLHSCSLVLVQQPIVFSLFSVTPCSDFLDCLLSRSCFSLGFKFFISKRIEVWSASLLTSGVEETLPGSSCCQDYIFGGFYYLFNLLTSFRFIQIFYFFYQSVVVHFGFVGICLFHLDYPVSWCTVVQSTQNLFYFCKINYSAFCFVSDFIWIFSFFS